MVASEALTQKRSKTGKRKKQKVRQRTPAPRHKLCRHHRAQHYHHHHLLYTAWIHNGAQLFTSQSSLRFLLMYFFWHNMVSPFTRFCRLLYNPFQQVCVNGNLPYRARMGHAGKWWRVKSRKTSHGNRWCCSATDLFFCLLWAENREKNVPECPYNRRKTTILLSV